MKIEGLEQKDLEFTIKWVVEVCDVFEEGIEDYLERLREIGLAEITSVALIDRKVQ